MKHYNIMKMTKDYNKYTANLGQSVYSLKIVKWYESWLRRKSLKYDKSLK